MDGQVIGVVSHIISQSGGSEGLGFVITSNLAREVLLEQRTIWSGLEGTLVSGQLAQALNLPQEAGVLVQRVAAGSPASTLGLKPGTMRAVVGGMLSVNGLIVVLALALVLLMGSPVGVAAESADAVAPVDSGRSLGAALATGLACIGAGIAVGIAGAAAIGGITEKPEILGKALIFVGLAEGIAIYGLIISFMILNG